MLAEGELDMILPMAWTKKTGKSGKQSTKSKLRAKVKKKDQVTRESITALERYPSKAQRRALNHSPAPTLLSAQSSHAQHCQVRK